MDREYTLLSLVQIVFITIISANDVKHLLIIKYVNIPILKPYR